MNLNDEAELIKRACAGDTSATRTLVERLRVPLDELSEACAGIGLPASEVMSVIAPAISAAIATFDARKGASFREHASHWMRQAVAGRLSQKASAPSN